MLPGKVTIKATFCISAHTDPEHAINYTRSGMGVTFRPLLGIGDETSTEFFGIKSQYKAKAAKALHVKGVHAIDPKWPY